MLRVPTARNEPDASGPLTTNAGGLVASLTVDTPKPPLVATVPHPKAPEAVYSVTSDGGVMVGAIVSTFTSICFSSSALPARSVVKYLTVWMPCALIVIGGPLNAKVGPSSTEYLVLVRAVPAPPTSVELN